MSAGIDKNSYGGSKKVTIYLGAKSGMGVYQTIIAQMPPHDCYIETHFGTGAVLRAKPRSARSIAIEIDPQTLKDFPPPAGVEVVNGCAHEYLRGFDFEAAGRVLVYIDPPYPCETRSSNNRYRFDYDTEKHLDLIALIKGLPCAVIISGYSSQLYRDELAGWRSIEFQAMTRGGPRTETIWMNFPAGNVQWSKFAGINFTDRQRIKRKAARWAANYKSLPSGERLAVLDAILKTHE
jgi:DNA adenine methylase